jgi:hypothetical protein
LKFHDPEARLLIDEKGNPIFTFGDPILDLIMDEEGITYISGKRLDLELGDSAARRGGISSIDLKKTDLADIRKYQLTHSLTSNGEFTLVERNGKITTIASSNPSALYRRNRFSFSDVNWDQQRIYFLE